MTFDKLMLDTNFMKSVFTAIGELEQSKNLDGAFDVVKSMYAAQGVELSSVEFNALIEQYNDAKKTVSELSDQETEMLSAGLNEINRLQSEDPSALKQLGNSFSQVGKMLKGLGE